MEDILYSEVRKYSYTATVVFHAAQMNKKRFAKKAGALPASSLSPSSVIGYARRKHLLDVRSREAPAHPMNEHENNRRLCARL